MNPLLDRVKTGVVRHKGQLLSVVAHSALIFALFGGIGHAPKLVPYRLPGTAKGNTLLTYYMPGSAHPVASKTPYKTPDKAKVSPVLKQMKAAAQTDAVQQAQATAGVGSAAESGLGEGNITIALQSYFPYPTPDLSTLPHGTKGDVILDAVIDQTGKITGLTLVKGIGQAVDQSVIATVQQWRYTPAMKDGVPIASEQELHFHYERG